MKIENLEQLGVIIESDSGYRLGVDIGHYTPSEKLEGVKVDAMTASHLHFDHFLPANIKKLAPPKLFLSQECAELLTDPEIKSEVVNIKISDTVMMGDIKATVFYADHGPNISVVPKENFGFLFETDGEKIYFAGDMFYPSGLDVSQLEVDVALLPVGTFYTFGPAEAVDFAKQFKKIGKIIPKHYHKTPQTKEEFIKLATEAGLVAEE